MNEHLMRALVEQTAFLALADDSIVDQDAAVMQLEQIGAQLQRLTPDERRQFIAFTRKLEDEERNNQNEDLAGFLATLPENFGLTDER